MATNPIKIKATIVTSAVGSITINGIPQTFSDLEIIYSAKNTASGANEVRVQLNSTSATTGRFMDNGAGSPRAGVSGNVNGIIQGTDYTPNTYSRNRLYIPNYTGNQLKVMSVQYQSENNATAAYAGMSACYFNVTTGVTSITLTPATGNFEAGCSFEVYGYVNATQTATSIPKAFGGNIVVNDGTYWYHAFLSSGSFTPKNNLTCELLLVGGGGGGSNSGGVGAGGGGGAIYYESNVSLPASISNPILVGGGGVPDARSTGDGASGSPSSFGIKLATVSNRAKGSLSSSPRDGGDGGASRSTINGTVTNYSGGTGAPTNYPRRGGSGAGAGSNGSSTYPAVGGNGLNTWSAWASATGTGDSGYYAGGGAGGYEYNGSMSRTAGGLGGGGMGGAGTSNPNYNATDGAPNTGGGGGGCGGQSGVIGGESRKGGSGIVIIKYAMA